MSALVSDTPQKHYQENVSIENKVNNKLTPDLHAEIKSEPPEDIDDTPRSLVLKGVPSPDQRKPNIRLTPTMKLLASPNPVDPKRKFSCPYDNCSKSYGKSSHLRSHLTWHTGIKPYVCQEPNCGKSFTRSDELNRHSRTHTGEKPFECMQCGKKFSRSDHLTKHVATHTKQFQTQKRARAIENLEKRPLTNDRNTETSEEKAAGPGVSEPRMEMANGKPLSTDQQSDIPLHVIDAPAIKKRNTKLTELTLPGQDVAFTDGMQFMASLLECAQFKHGRHVIETENLSDEQLEAARLPLRIKLEKPEHSDEYKIVNTVKEEATETVTNAAITVYNATNTYDNESNGLNTADDTDDDENVTDDSIMLEANATIPFSHSARPHAEAVPRLDHLERPYGCHQCVKSFKRQDDLNRHLRTHTGEKPYACTECEKRFMRSDHLKKHLKTHFKQL